MDEYGSIPPEAANWKAPNSSETEKDEKTKYIEHLIDEIKQGRAAFGMYGKINKNIVAKNGKTFVPTGEYQSVNYDGKQDFRVDEIVQAMEAGKKLADYEAGMLMRQNKPGGENKIEDLIIASALFKEVEEGTVDQEYTELEAGFMGRKKEVKKVRKVPKKVRKPLLLGALTKNGSDQPAYAISIVGDAGGRDYAGRPYENRFVIAVSKAEIDKIFGTPESQGGLLKKYPDLLVRAIEKESPDLAEDFKHGLKSNHREALVIADNFGNSNIGNDFTYSDLSQKLGSGELKPNVISYDL